MAAPSGAAHEEAAAAGGKRGKEEEEEVTEARGDGEPERKRVRVTQNETLSSVPAVATDGNGAGTAYVPPRADVKEALHELLVLERQLRALRAAAAAAAAGRDGETEPSEEQRVYGRRLVAFIRHSDKSVREAALGCVAEAVNELDAGEVGTAVLAATDAVLAASSSSSVQPIEADVKLLGSVYGILREMCVHVGKLSHARHALRDFQARMDATVAAFVGLLRRRSAAMDVLERRTYQTAELLLPDRDFFIETLVDAFNSNARTALELFFRILGQVAADAGEGGRASSGHASGMDAILTREAATWFNATVAPDFLAMLSCSKDETSSMHFMSAWGARKATAQRDLGNGGKKEEEVEDAKRRYASCAYRCDDAYERIFGHMWLPGETSSALRASAITESGAAFEQEILVLVSSVRTNAPPVLASAIHNFVTQFKLPKMATTAAAHPPAVPSSVPAPSASAPSSAAAAPTGRISTEPTTTSTQPAPGEAPAGHAAAWKGTLLKNGGRLCSVSISNQITKRGVYQPGDTVTEPEGFRLAEGVNGGKPIHGGVTVAAGDPGINVVARGDMSKMLSYVLSKNASQYFVLKMHTATEQKYWKPPLSDRDEAKTFVMSLREKPRAGVCRLSRGRSVYLFPVSSSVTKALQSGMTSSQLSSSKDNSDRHTPPDLYAVVIHPDKKIV